MSCGDACAGNSTGGRQDTLHSFPGFTPLIVALERPVGLDAWLARRRKESESIIDLGPRSGNRMEAVKPVSPKECDSGVAVNRREGRKS